MSTVCALALSANAPGASAVNMELCVRPLVAGLLRRAC